MTRFPGRQRFATLEPDFHHSPVPKASRRGARDTGCGARAAASPGHVRPRAQPDCSSGRAPVDPASGARAERALFRASAAPRSPRAAPRRAALAPRRAAATPHRAARVRDVFTQAPRGGRPSSPPAARAPAPFRARGYVLDTLLTPS